MTASLLRVTRRQFRRLWMPALVVLAMVSAWPVVADATGGVPGFGVLLAGVLGLFGRYVGDELTR